MTSWRSDSFKKDFAKLPPEIQDLTDVTYHFWKESPFHPSLHFKHLDNNIWSVRIGRGHRAMGVRDRDEIVWFWVGSHADYDKLYGSTKTLEKSRKMSQKKPLSASESGSSAKRESTKRKK